MVTRHGNGFKVKIIISFVVLVCAGWFAPPGVTAQTGLFALEPEMDPRAARFGIVLQNLTGRSEGVSLLDAAATAMIAYPETFWFHLDELDPDLVRLYQAEVIVHLTAELHEERPDSEDLYRVSARFDAVPLTIPSDLSRLVASPPEPVVETSMVVPLDRGGRYLRDATWLPLIRSLERAVRDARPVVTVTITGDGPITVHGYPEWLAPEIPREPQDVVYLELRTLRSYTFTIEAEGYRRKEISFYLERRPLEITVEHQKYPRHSVAFVARGVSWPGIEYAWYNRDTDMMLFAGVTTFGVGVTPLRQLGTGFSGTDARSPKLFDSRPLTELELGFGRFRDGPEEVVRRTFSGALLLRFTNVDSTWELEPVMPSAVRLALGREREISNRFVLTQRLATDFFVPVQMGFLRQTHWAIRVGPVLWQLPIYRLGLRVVL